MTADALADSCADIARWLPVGAALLTEPDVDGSTVHGQPSSRLPGNQAAFDAVMSTREGLRRLEASMRLAVTGRTGPRRGGSDANTAAAIAAIEALGNALTAEAMVIAAHVLDAWSRAIQQLPAVDEIEPWQRVAGAQCPYCGAAMLRLSPRAGRVTCLRFGVCADGDGNHPVGFVQQGLDGTPLVAWADGLVQYGTIGEVPAS